MQVNTFQEEIRAGIPAELPEPQPYDESVNHAPVRKDILTAEEKVLALQRRKQAIINATVDTTDTAIMESLTAADFDELLS